MPPTTAQRALRHHAEELAATLPPLLVEAERVAITVSQGVHGRRRVGQGETFWQFRQYEPGEPAQRIDWRESARSDRLYVRETEWEASERLDLARQLAFDGLRLGSEPADQARARRPGDARTGGAADPRRRARDPAGLGLSARNGNQRAQPAGIG